MILASAVLVFASPFSDVPENHWSIDAINSLTSKGIINGYEDGTFGGKRVVSRYHLAVVLSRMLASVEQKPDKISRSDLKVIERLTIEFADELSLMNISVKSLEDELYGIKKDVSSIKKDVKNLQDFIKNGGNDKVRISGDMTVRNYEYKREKNGYHENRTESLFRIHLDTKISEKISAHSTWNLIENDNDRANPFATNEWNGGNKNTGSVERAYFKLKNLLNKNETIKIGRDWYSHGHGLVVHDFMDAISFSKPVKNADLAFNLFFNRSNSYNQKDYLNIWNINIDYYYKNQKLYLGFYYNSRDWSWDIDYGNPTVVELNKNAKDFRVEMGASGNIGKKTSGLTYDLASVYNGLETYNKKHIGNNVKELDLKGWLTHVAIKYDTKKDYTFKLAYTYADEESYANIKRNDFNSYCLREETPFEDLSRLITPRFGGILYNIKNYNAQIGYTLKNAKKHSFRLAYDKLQEVDSAKGFETDTDLITAEYRYQISQNTRIRFIYQNSKDKKGCFTPINKSTQMLMTEIYTRF